MQVQRYTQPKIGMFAMSPRMADVQDDIKLIRDLIKWADTNAAQVAKRIGVANTTINRFNKGTAETRLHRDTLAKLKEAFPRFPAFVQSRDLSDLQDGPGYVDVAVVPSFAGMGGGGNGEGEIVTAKLPRTLIEDELRGKAPDFEMIDVRGDSMTPDFQHGDQILIDKRDRNPRQPGPFALWDGDGYVLKVVERIPGRMGWYRVFSVNDRYSPYEVEETETTIMGRPVWFARRL